jgi:hypothetical protein
VRIAELVTPDRDALLDHPVCGFVRWAPEFPGSGSRFLTWATGPERGRPLVVDDTVLFCDQWSRTNAEALARFEAEARAG